MNQSTIEIKIPRKFRTLFKPARYHVFYGGRGSGKSHTVARALVFMAMQDKKKILCAREFQNSISESVHALLSGVINDYGLHRYFVIQNNSITCKNGSEFIFKGLAHNLESVKSTEGIDICWLEEADRISQRSWDTLTPTVRKPGSFFIVTFNPDNEDDPTYQKFVVVGTPDSIVTKVSYADNPMFPEVLQREMEHLKSYDFEKYLHVWEGHIRTISDAQIFKGKYVVEEFSSDGVENFRFGMDFGFANDPLCICRSFIKERRLYVDYASYGYGIEINDIPNILKSIPGSDKYRIYGDNSRPETISYLKNLGWKVEAARKWSGSVEDGIEYLRSFDKIVFHPKTAKDGIYEAGKYSYKTDKHTGEILPIPVDAYNHCIAPGQLVTTTHGDKFIEDIREGDFVRTRSGFNKVLFSGVTDYDRDVVEVTTQRGTKIICTPDHEIWTSKGWTRADALRYDDEVTSLEVPECVKNQNVLNGMAKHIGAIQNLISSISKPHGKIRIPHIFTAMFGNSIMEKSRKDFTSITEMRIHETMSSKISNASLLKNIWGELMVNGLKKELKNIGSILIKLDRFQSLGILRQKASNSIDILAQLLMKILFPSLRNVVVVGNYLNQRHLVTEMCNVQMLANQSGADNSNLIISKKHVHTVKNQCLSQNSNLQRLVPDRVATVCVIKEKAPKVYDITVENEHEFFLNGVLVSNCFDAIRYALDPLIKRKTSIYDTDVMA